MTTPILLLRRMTAAGLAALVMMLAVLAVTPDWHETMHADADHADHECAIVLYAGGVPISVAIIATPASESEWHENEPATPCEFVFAAPDYDLPLQCGPPARA